MEAEPLVSIISPCYNAGKVVHRMLDSVLAQTYDNIEFIVVDDGSGDNSKDVILSYKSRFEKRGFSLSYYCQEHAGVGKAMDTGLKLFHGEYLCWPDIDDYFEPESIEKRVRFLEEHPEYAVVTSDAYIRDSEHLNSCKYLLSQPCTDIQNPYRFELMLDANGILGGGCNMVRTSSFLDVNPDRSIYPSSHGQNWQILLPVYYKYKAFFLPEPLYNYIKYPQSLSSEPVSEKKYLERYDGYEDVLIKTLEMIEKNQNVKLDKYKLFVKNKYSTLRMAVAVNYCDNQVFDSNYAFKRANGTLTKKDKLLYLRRKSKILNGFYLTLRDINRQRKGGRI